MERAGPEELAVRDIQFYQLRFTRFGYQWLFYQGILKETGKALESKRWVRLHDLPVKERCHLDSGELLWDGFLLSDDEVGAIVEEEKVGVFRGPHALQIFG